MERCSTSLAIQFSSVPQSCPTSLWPHESQHARPPCPSPTTGVYSNSRPSSWWCHPAISSSCPQCLSLAIRKTQVKTTMRYHFIAIYSDYNPKDKHCQVLVRMWRKHVLLGGMLNGKQLVQKSDGQILKKLNIWPSNSIPRLIAKRSEHIWIHSNL